MKPSSLRICLQGAVSSDAEFAKCLAEQGIEVVKSGPILVLDASEFSLNPELTQALVAAAAKKGQVVVQYGGSSLFPGVTALLLRGQGGDVVAKTLATAFKAQARKQLIDEVGQLDLFKGLTTQDLAQTLACMQSKKLAKSDYLWRDGDTAGSCYVLLKGKLEAMPYKLGALAACSVERHPGACLGLVEIFTERPRRGSVLAVEDSWLLECKSENRSKLPQAFVNRLVRQVALLYAELVSATESFINHLEPQSEVASLEEPETTEPVAAQQSAPDASNPYAVPCAAADFFSESCHTQEDYEVLRRKTNLRTGFITAKVPNGLADVVRNKLYGYWTGGKLAKINPHKTWDVKWFAPGMPRLMKALHMVVVAGDGLKAHKQAYLGLELSHRTVGMTDVGCVGTFLGTDEAVNRYLAGRQLEYAIKQDFELPIDRIWEGKECIEFLRHTREDVRPGTLFLIFDEEDGRYTAKVREAFPEHQLLTIVSGYDFDSEDLSTLFTHPEEQLRKDGLLVAKQAYEGKGFYSGETQFFPDLSCYFKGTNMGDCGYIFATIGIFAQIGPDYSGVVWGSKGGAEGAVRASRAMFGLGGAQSAADIAAAVSWADG